MKFSRFVAWHSHRRGGREEVHRTTLEPFIKPVAHRAEIHTYAELRQQIHDDLRIQHPEWVNPNGESPMCDVYEARLTETLEKLTRRGSDALALTAIRSLSANYSLDGSRRKGAVMPLRKERAEKQRKQEMA